MNTPMGELCGAWGGCILPEGHNLGRIDIPANHQLPEPSDPQPMHIDPALIVEQRAKGWVDFHPEDFCHECGSRNLHSWNAHSDLFNQAFPAHVIVCPQCFVEAWEKATGLRANWRLTPEDIHVPTDEEE